jgi:hypothetical protein
MLHLECVAWLEQNGRVIDELPVQHGIHAHHVLVNLRLDLVRHVVIDRVAHVLWQHILKTLLVEKVIVKYLHQHVQEPLVLVRVETYFEDFVCSGT